MSIKALILGLSSLAFSVSGLFAVAASGAGGASPAEGTMGRGFKTCILCHTPTPQTLYPSEATALNCACLFTEFWVVEK